MCEYEDTAMDVENRPTQSNGAQYSATKESETQNIYMQFFRTLSPKEAQVLKKWVKIDNDLHHYISRMLYAVESGKEVPVPVDFPVQAKSLKISIKKVAKGMGISVRFDPSVEGGFIVRAATPQEEMLGKAQGERLAALRTKKNK
jgi:hypothetical protein